MTANGSGRYAQFIIPGIMLLVLLYLVIITRNTLLPFILSAALAYVLNP